MFSKSLYKKITALFAAAVLFAAALPFGAFAAEKGEIVLVGASPDFGINKNGTEYSGIAYEYLEQIAKYTGHRYTFVDGTSDELMTMLAEGKLDIIPCVSEADAELFRSTFGDSSMGASLTDYTLMKKYSAVYVPESGSDIAFYDIDALKSSRIGYLAEDEMKYFSEGLFVFTELEDANFIRYNTEEQMKSDFFSGKLDAVVKECFRPWGGESIVYQFGLSDCYFLTTDTDTKLRSQLSVATGSVTITNPYFTSDLYEKYISCFGMQMFALSSAEKAYIQKKVGLRIAYNQESDMLSSYDKSKKRVTGVMGDMIDDIQEKTGLIISITPCSTLNECMKLLEDGTVDAVCGGINTSSVSGYNNLLVTIPVTKNPTVIAGSGSASVKDHSKIAVPYYGSDIAKYIKELYPTATLLPYTDVKASMDAVAAGEADVVCASAYEVIYMMNGGYDEFSIITPLSAYHNECFALSADNSELASILGKTLARMSTVDSDVRAFSSMTSQGYDSMTLSRFIDKYLAVIIAVAVFVLIEVAIIIVFLKRSKKKTTEVDALTGGRTKQKFLEDSAKAVRKSSPEKWAILLFDINKFKYVNDRLGYDEGNRMLERLYKTVSDNVESDEVFARISDDNFALTIHNASDNEITARANMIFDEFARRNSLFVKYSVLFSAGVCRLEQCVEANGTVDFNAALDRATIAKKTQKGSHQSSIAFYDGKIREKALREKDFESVMPLALKQHEFICYLQPKYGLKSRRIEGAEALIRWNSKDFGFVYPDQFIPLSEKNGFVVELDFYILEEVCKAMRRWLDEGKVPVTISVNQSRLHLNNDDYIWRLREIVDKYDIPYEYIELELTESVFAENMDHLLTIMRKLHEIGFKLSIDDFGSGYSSLNMLKDIPADVIKIDREFFNGTVNSEKGRAVIETVVGLAKNLNMEVISEGVETIEQVDFLADINCHMVQGYYFAKPMPMDAFEKMWFKDLELAQQDKNNKSVPAGNG